mmetsp:Transcript_22729/g.40497  ORF Transcript_22729/g.40497 Transcript_22729/m.40497 type:complete len:549 (-) Transcript_22729:151-1797(-)
MSGLSPFLTSEEEIPQLAAATFANISAPLEALASSVSGPLPIPHGARQLSTKEGFEFESPLQGVSVQDVLDVVDRAPSSDLSSAFHDGSLNNADNNCSDYASDDVDTVLGAQLQVDTEIEMELAPPLEHDLLVSDAAVLAQLGARRLRVTGVAGMSDVAREIIAENENPDDMTLFYIYDLGMVARLYQAWVSAMPRVTPFYAVKCNPDKGMLLALAAMGAGFDCASGAEINAVLDIGVYPSRIIFANCQKFPRDLRIAEAHGLRTTFDSVAEAQKIATHSPHVALVLRIRSDDTTATAALGNKYGAEMEEVEGLLEAAKELNLNVVGISFHVGSGARNPNAYDTAITKARWAFDMGKKIGFRDMNILDIGGGMSCKTDAKTGAVTFNGFPQVVCAALARLFPPEEGVFVIGEPGRYFAEHSASLATSIFGARSRNIPGVETAREYWISDGIYGAFNCIFYDHVDGHVGEPLRSPHLPPVSPEVESQRHNSVIFGPTCDGLDCVSKSTQLPEMRVGDWLLYHDFGAYTIAGATDFNGIPVSRPNVYYVY